MKKKALIVIDVQKDYFPGGNLTLNNAEQTLNQILIAVEKAKSQNMPVFLIQHIVPAGQGPAPFFNEGTSGANIHPRLLELLSDAPIVIKTFADSFQETSLSDLIRESGIDELLICGMMTQHCVTHTTLSKAADDYIVNVLADACTTVDELVHNIALQGLSSHANIVTVDQAFSY